MPLIACHRGQSRQLIKLPAPTSRSVRRTSAASAAVLTGLLMAHFLPERTVEPTIAIAVLVACGLNLARIAIQVFAGDYLWLRPSKIQADAKARVRKQLSALVLLGTVLTLLGAAWGVVVLSRPDAALAWRVAPPFALCFSLYLVALATVDRAGELNLKRGTEIFRESNFGGWLFKIGRSGDDFRPVKWLLDLFDTPTSTDRPSTLSLVIAVVLLTAPLATLAVEAGHSAKSEVISTLEHWTRGAEKGSGTGGGGEEEEEGEAPSAASGQEQGSGNAPVVAVPSTGPIPSLNIVIGKTDSSDPGTQVPLNRSDVPYLLAALPFIVRLRQIADLSAGTLGDDPIYVLITRGSLTLQLVAKRP